MLVLQTFMYDFFKVLKVICAKRVFVGILPFILRKTLTVLFGISKKSLNSVASVDLTVNVVLSLPSSCEGEVLPQIMCSISVPDGAILKQTVFLLFSLGVEDFRVFAMQNLNIHLLST